MINVTSATKRKVGPNDIARLEKNCFPLPNDYKQFLLKYNECEVKPNEFKIAGNGSSCVRVFFGIENNREDLRTHLIGRGEIYGASWMAIGRDGVGNFILISHKGEIGFWDHEFESDNITIIAPSFTEFINLLHESDNGGYGLSWSKIIINNPNDDDAIKVAAAVGDYLVMKDEYGWSFASACVVKNRRELFYRVVSMGARIDDCYVPAVLNNRTELLDYLLENNASPNVKSGFGGDTAIHSAAASNPELLPRLLRAGGDLTILNNAGLTPLDVAKKAMKQKSIDIINDFLSKR